MIDPVKRLESYGVTATFTADRPNDFPLAVSRDLSAMDPRLFRPEPMGLELRPARSRWRRP